MLPFSNIATVGRTKIRSVLTAFQPNSGVNLGVALGPGSADQRLRNSAGLSRTKPSCQPFAEVLSCPGSRVGKGLRRLPWPGR